MDNFKKVLEFGWPYLHRYWGRLLAGILLGILFGLSNGSFIWASRTLTERLAEPSEQMVSTKTVETAKPSVGPKIGSVFKGELSEVKNSFEKAIDPWLPLAGRPFDWRQFLGTLLFLPLLVSIRSITDYLGNYCMGWVSERAINDLRVDVLAKLNSLSLDYFNRSTSGDMMTRITMDTANLHRALKDGCSEMVKELFTLVTVFAVLCYMDWKLTLFAMIFLPLCVLPIAVLGKKVKRASRASRIANVSQNSLLIELLASIRVVKAFGLEEKQIGRFREYSRQLIHHGMKNVQAKEMVKPIIEVVSMLGVGVLIVYIFYTKQSVSDLVAFLTGLAMFFVPIKKLAGIHISFEQASAGVDRLVDLLREQPSVKEPKAPKPLKGFSSSLEFSNVSFAYGTQPVLKNVSFSVPRGFKLGIAGESGSGKSTLVNLTFRFYDPTAGSIKIDGIDLRECSVTDLRQEMALVSQDIVLFNQSVAENIACGKLDATREEIEAAAKAAYAHEFIMQMPHGYDTNIGERGVTLSGGQRQRLAIARAFVRNAPILVLDEATASLDSQSEAEVQAAIEKLEQNRTVICVAHRLSTLTSMDQIIVLSQGQIIEQGSFGDLLKADGPFAAMARRQGISTAVTATA